MTPLDEITSLDDVTAVLREHLDKRQTGNLAINQRLDFLVSKLGGLEEIGHHVALIDERVQKLEIVEHTQINILTEAQESFDLRTQIVLKDNEALMLS
jgi:hypothetical protein